MNRLLENHWVSIIARMFLGSIFVYSAWPKLIDPPGFAHAIWNYQILPSYSINLLAMTLPWLEILAGAALIAGVFRRGAALVAAWMLAVFIAALALNLHRGVAVDCGCFSVAAAGKSHEELMATMKLDVLRDAGLLLLAVQVYFTPVTWLKLGPKMR